MTPSLAVFMICKNEEAHIGKALYSVSGIANAIVVCDTGSTDGTREMVRRFENAEWNQYFGASEKDEAHNWVLWNFADARNRAATWAEEQGCSHVMWLDADDVVEQPERIARALYRNDVDVFAMTVESGGMRWLHHRMWRTDKHVRFRGRCHEYPVLDGLRGAVLDVTIRHDAAPVEGQENANARNLRMLMRDWQEKEDSRTAFYIAQTHKDGGRHAEAITWYRRRIELGEHYRDEWLFAQLYLARSFAGIGNIESARATLAAGIVAAPEWAEFRTGLAWKAYEEKRYDDAIALALKAHDAPIPPTELWREVNAYTDQPCRLLSFCYEAQGDIGKACAWARMALDRIGAPDAEWQARIATLETRLVTQEKAGSIPAHLPRRGATGDGLTPCNVSGETKGTAGPAVKVSAESGMGAPSIVTRRKERIALVRPGAIGDVLMTLNLLPAFKEANPDADVHYFTSVRGLDQIIRAAGAIPMVTECEPSMHDRVIYLVGYPLAEGYPDKPMAHHLLQYFAWELNVSIQDGLPALELPLPPFPHSRSLGSLTYATLQTRAGWSKYKSWTKAWQDAINALPFQVVCIDEQMGKTLPYVIAQIANARMHLGIDSFANHLTNYFWRDGRSARRVPGVILWGSTQWQAAGYPHNINLSAGLHCQPCFRENPAISHMPRGPCINPPRATYEDDTPHACMEAISVEQVVEAALELWKKTGDPRHGGPP